MKTLHFTIILMSTIGIFVIINSDTVVIGKVLSSVPFSPTQMKYQIQVEQYLRNPQDQDVLTVIAEGTNKTLVQQGYAPDTVYDVGQRVFLYLKKENDIYGVWYFSHSTDFLCSPAPTKEEMNFTVSPNPIFASLPAYSQLKVGESGVQNTFLVNQSIPISFDAWNRYYTAKSFDVVFEIKDQTEGTVYNITKSVELKPCIGHQTVSTNFVPKTTGTYEINVIFDNSLQGTTVEVRHNFSSNGLEITSMPPPLQQTRVGIKAEDVKCKEGLHLVIKAEDDSPACVKLDTAYMLIKREWATSESAYPGADRQFSLDTNSTIIPGHLPRHSGLMIPYQKSSRTLDYTGFDGVYNVTLMFRGTPQDYVLKPGDNGTITFEIDAKASELPGQSYSTSIPKSLNLTNYAVFYHEITNIKDLSKYPGVTISNDYGFKTCFTRPGGGGTCQSGQFEGTSPIEAYVVDHPGVNVLFEPPFETLQLGPNTTSQVVTMMISVDDDALKGTYLVEIPDLGEFLLTVGNQPYHE